MNLSSELVSQFVKITNDGTKDSTETTVYGTIVQEQKSGKLFVQLDGSNELTPISTTANYALDDRVTVRIKNHTATITGNLSSPAVSTAQGNATNDRITEVGTLVADKVSTEELAAESARIDNLVAENAVIKDTLNADNAEIGNLTATNADITNRLTAAEADIDDLSTNKLDASVAAITYATIKNLDATNAKVYNLESTYGEFVELTTDHFSAIDADIADLQANKADIADANIMKADIADLDAEVANLDTLIFGSATGDTIQTSFSNSVIAQLGDAQIKSAMIESVAASKITAGDIITNKIRVKSEDGSLLISDETMQISDETRVRVQIGKDASGDYSINIWDQNGNLMFSEGGITDSAIKDAIIRNDMVSDTANIAAHKLDIDSLFEEINGSANTIKSTKIYVDDKNQTLDVAFKTLSEDVGDLESTVTSQGTQITAIQGQITSKIWQQDINTAKGELEKETETLSTQYSMLEQELDGVSATVASHTSQIATKADNSTVTTVNNKVTSLESNLNGFKTTVSNTYATKNDVTSIEIGGRNFWENGDFSRPTPSGKVFCSGHSEIVDLEAGNPTGFSKAVHLYNGTGQVNCNRFSSASEELTGRTLTLSCWIKYSDVKMGSNDWNELNIGKYALVYVQEDDTTTAPNYGSLVAASVSGSSDGWVHMSGSYTLRSDVKTVAMGSIRIGMEASAAGDVWVTGIKLEFGDKATDWTPAPEDLASSSDLSSLTNRVSTAETSISQNESAIALRATKTEVTEAIGNIAIGGRNLIRDSKLDKDTDMWNMDYNHHTISFDNGYFEVSRVYDASYTNRTFNNQYSTTNVLLLPDEISGKTYAIQAELKAIDGIVSTANSSIFWRVYYDDNTQYEEISLAIPNDLSPTEWRRCYATHTFGDKNWTKSQITIALANQDNGVCVRNIMLERATKPSAWSPAPEDMATNEDLTDLADRMTTAETAIKQNTESIKLAATKTEVTNTLSGYYTKSQTDAAITTKANAITSNVSATYATKTSLAATDANMTLLGGDPTNYAKLNNSTASKWGFTIEDDAEGDWYVMSYLSRDTTISPEYECFGGEQIKIDYEVISSVKGITSSGGSTTDFLNINVGLYCKRDSGGHFIWPGVSAGKSSDSGEIMTGSGIITLHEEARKFQVNVQISGWPTFTGAIKIRNVRVSKVAAVENRVIKAESNITQLSDKITANVTETNGLKSRMSTVEQTASGLTVRLDSAESNITTAQSTANTAKSNAATAQSTADAAKTAAANAQSTANTANTTANAAKKQKYHEASGTNAVAGYVGFCTLKVTGTYVNAPITFNLSNRGQQSSNVSFCLNSANSTDPTLSHIQSDGGVNVWAYKSTTSTWILIAQKSEAYDIIYVNEFANPRSGVTATWSNIHYDTLPTSNITAATRLAAKLTKATVDNAAKTATNYLNFSSAGLVVGDHTGSSLGKNVLIDSDSVDIRNGSTTLASFGADTITLGQNAENSVINLCDGAGTIKTAISETATAYPKYDALAIESQELNLMGKRIYLDTEYTGSTYSGASSMTLMSTNSGIGSDCTVTSTGKTNQTGVSCDATDNYVNTHSNVYAIGWDATAGDYIYNYVSVYPLRTQFSQPISINGNTVTGANKVLWSGGYYMTSSHSCTLSEGVYDQTNGIVLVFSEYRDGAAVNNTWHSIFVAKEMVVLHAGAGHCFQMSTSNLAYYATKYLYISNTKITGHDNNDDAGSADTGITRTNNRFVLRYVIGV